MSDAVARAAYEVAKYATADDPSADTRKNLLDYLNTNIGTDPALQTELQQKLQEGGLLPKLALQEFDNINGGSGGISSGEADDVADRLGGDMLTTMAANFVDDKFDDIKASDNFSIFGARIGDALTWVGGDGDVDKGELEAYYRSARDASGKSLTEVFGIGPETTAPGAEVPADKLFTKDTPVEELKAAFGNHNATPDQRLQAAWALVQNNVHSVSVVDGDVTRDMNIVTDANGMIGVFNNGTVVMRGVYRGGHVGQQAGVDYFGDVWRRNNPNSVFRN